MADIVGTLNLVIPQGSDFKRELTLKIAGVAIDITGWSFAAELRAYHGGALLAPFVFTIIDAVNGRVDMTLTDVVTAALDAGLWVWDMERTNTVSEVRRLLEGAAEVTPEVTTGSP